MTTRLLCSMPAWLLCLLAAVTPSPAAETKKDNEKDVALEYVTKGHWIECQGQKKVSEVTVDMDEMPKNVLELLSPSKDLRKLDSRQIRELAKKHHLMEAPEFNDHLRFDDGDIGFFAGQDKKAYELEVEFLARRLIRAAAERDHLKITNKGDWSFWAEKLRGEGLGDKANEYWKAQKK